MLQCPCGSEKPYADCCEPVISDARPAETAEQLMRSRYSAYALAHVDHIVRSTHADHRGNLDENGIRQWSQNSEWHGLEIVEKDGGSADDDTGMVEFIAHYTEKGERKAYHERAIFERVDDRWYFKDGELVRPKQYIRETPKVGRNDPCPCGSGKKHKKCCGK